MKLRIFAAVLFVVVLATAVLGLTYRTQLGQWLGKDTKKATSRRLGDFGASTTISFSLDRDYDTSAGVYDSTGTLIRTLWRTVHYTAGMHSASWDGKDNDGNDMPAGDYQIKVAYFNVKYAWDGAIATTASAKSGPTVLRGFQFPLGMSVSGTSAYLVMGYSEYGWPAQKFDTTDPTKRTDYWWWSTNAYSGVPSSPSRVDDTGMCSQGWNLVTSDGTAAYYGITGFLDGSTHTTGPGVITATAVADGSLFSLSSGARIPCNSAGNAPIEPGLSNGITVGTQAGMNGIAVQRTGPLLAASVGADNKVYLFNKATGAAAGNFAVTNPKSISFAPDGTLWVASDTTLTSYKASSLGATDFTSVSTVTGLDKPLAVAASLTSSNLVLLADGGASQQVKAYDATGSLLWTLGQHGGYTDNGPDVTNDKFMFTDNYPGNAAFLAFQPDDSFWLGDVGNRRALHFSAARSYINNFSFVGASYNVQTDAADSSRLFSSHLEYSIDYTKPLSQGWTLTKNWAGPLVGEMTAPTGNIESDSFLNISTLSNGRTYAMLSHPDDSNELVELTSSGLRLSGSTVGPAPYPQQQGGLRQLLPDGRIFDAYPNGNKWEFFPLTGFNGSNWPTWGTKTTVVPQSHTANDPLHYGGGVLFGTVLNNKIISLDTSFSNTGFHLGMADASTGKWLWKESPSVNTNYPPDNKGSYDIGDGALYGGQQVVANGNNIVYVYGGEFWHGGEANQVMHYTDDGLFVGQFGQTGIPGYAPVGISTAGVAGNSITNSLITAPNGEVYMWTTDEDAHGPQRWHLEGANNIKETTGTGPLGGTVILTNASSTAPANLKATVASTSGQVDLSWTAVPGASSYHVKYGTTEGGAYDQVVTGVSGTTYSIPSLTNGTTYFAVVTAVVSGVESPPSTEVKAIPLNPASAVVKVGEITQYALAIDDFNLTTTRLGTGLPAVESAESNPTDSGFNDSIYEIKENLALDSFGRLGYAIFNSDNQGHDTIATTSPYSIVKGSGWLNTNYANNYHFIFDHVPAPGTSPGSPRLGIMSANSTGTITIHGDASQFLLLTLMFPSNSGQSLSQRITVTGANDPGNPVITTTTFDKKIESGTTYQYYIKGDATVTVDKLASAGGSLKAIFLDPLDTSGPLPALSDTSQHYTLCTTLATSTSQQLTGTSPVTIEAVNPQGSVTDTFNNLSSDGSAHITLRDAPLFQDLLNTDTLRVTLPGYLKRKATSTPTPGVCAIPGSGLVAGDFDGDNTVSLGDLVTLIAAYNGVRGGIHDTAANTFGGQPTLGDLVTIIRNYNQAPNGD